jgi:hypothetical protein
VFKFGTQSARSQGGHFQQSVSLTAGHTYLLQTWLKTDGNVVGGGALGAGVSLVDPGQNITIQKVNGVAQNAVNQNPGVIFPTTTAVDWTLIQMTFSVNATGSYSVSVTDDYGSNALNANVWFDGVSLTDTTGAADVTSSQAIVYAGASANIIPNGDFILGNVDGWATAIGTIVYDAPNKVALLNGNSEASSPSFNTVPGQKYRFTFTCWAAVGAQATYLRVYGAGQYAPNILNISGDYAYFLDLLTPPGSSIPTGPTTFTYDWTCPANIFYCSLALATATSTNLAISRVIAQDYGASGEWGADVTSTNTANDTNNVSGVPSSTIAQVVPTGYRLFINNGSRSYSFQAV